ncbi:MAG: hypothetical protein ACJ75Z_09760 [Solirubrobacterales bacterium]
MPNCRIVGERLLRDHGDRLLWIPSAPTLRARAPDGLCTLENVDWTITQEADDVVVRASESGAEADVVELDATLAGAFLEDQSETMLVQPVGAALGGPRDLARFLLGDQIVVVDDGRAWPTEQVALSMYRIARLRGGPLWEAFAAHVARGVAARLEQAGASPLRHSYWGAGETHVRMLADAVLLMVAHAEATGAARFARAAAAAAAQLAAYAVPWGGGTWYLHDSLEREAGHNDLVLNTHVHATLALLAAGRDVEGARTALEAALSLRCRRPGAYLHAAAIAASDAMRAVAPAALGVPVRDITRSIQGAAGHYRSRFPHLRAPGGWVARDVRPGAPHVRYLIVNLNDLAMARANLSVRGLDAALASGLRYARITGYLQAERRKGEPVIAMMPTLLQAMGRQDQAGRFARRLRSAGWAPAVGWPGYVDSLWSRLATGTP